VIKNQQKRKKGDRESQREREIERDWFRAAIVIRRLQEREYGGRKKEKGIRRDTLGGRKREREREREIDLVV
jgi:hypothetical protein